MRKIEGSGSASGSISQRHGSADPDPDPHQNIMDPEHCHADPADQTECGSRSTTLTLCISLFAHYFSMLEILGWTNLGILPERVEGGEEGLLLLQLEEDGVLAQDVQQHRFSAVRMRQTLQ